MYLWVLSQLEVDKRLGRKWVQQKGVKTLCLGFPFFVSPCFLLSGIVYE